MNTQYKWTGRYLNGTAPVANARVLQLPRARRHTINAPCSESTIRLFLTHAKHPRHPVLSMLLRCWPCLSDARNLLASWHYS